MSEVKVANFNMVFDIAKVVHKTAHTCSCLGPIPMDFGVKCHTRSSIYGQTRRPQSACVLNT